jgi:hypothetical protein
MRTLLSAVSVFSLGISSLLLGGCEVTDCKTDEGEDAKCAESLKAFEATESVETVPYVDGANLTINGLYGDIAILPGSAGKLTTTFKPFNYRGHDQEEDARRELEENLDLRVDHDLDGTGDVTITTDRHDATNGLGSHITVRLPPEFNGILIVENEGNGVINQGLIDVQSVGEATTLNVTNHGLDRCNVLRGEDDEPSIVSNLNDVNVRCEADIFVRGVNDNVVVRSVSPPFHSDVRVDIVGVSPDAIGGSIIGDNSNVQVTFPVMGDYDVVASAGDGASMSRVEPGECEASPFDYAGISLTCGAGGPTYEISATGVDDASRINVFVR